MFVNGTSPHRDAETHFVSIGGHERVLDHPPTQAELEDFVGANIGILSQPAYFLGGWLDEGFFYLDVSVALQGRHKALKFAAENNQKAIWHPSTKRSIEVEEAVDALSAEQTVALV